MKHNNFKIGLFKKEFLVSLALVLISQTKARLFNSVGIGELLLVGFMISQLFNKKFQKEISRFSGDAWPNLYVDYYGLLFAVAVLVSSLMNYLFWADTGILFSASGLHNLISYFYAGLFFLILQKSDLNINMTAYVYCIVMLAVLLLEYLFFPLYSLFYADIRYASLSQNPNQLALALLLIPFICVSAQQYFTEKTNIIAFQILFCLIMVLLYFVHSSAVLVSYSSALFVFILFKLINKKSSINLSIGVISLLLCVSGTLYFQHIGMNSLLSVNKNQINQLLINAETQARNTENSAHIQTGVLINERNIASNQDSENQSNLFRLVFPQDLDKAQGKKFIVNSLKTPLVSFNSERESRLFIWQIASDSIIKQPIWGYGSDRDVVIPKLEKSIETHNTFLDIALKTGFVGLLSFVLFITLIITRLFKSSRVLELSALFAIIAFSCFHNILRQPIVWFYLSYLMFSIRERDLA